MFGINKIGAVMFECFVHDIPVVEDICGDYKMSILNITFGSYGCTDCSHVYYSPVRDPEVIANELL